MAARLPWTMTSVGRDDSARRLKGRNPSVDRKKFRKTAGGASPSPTGRRGNIPRREIGGRPHRAAPTTSQAKNSKAGGRADLLTRPPVLGQVSFHAEGFALWASSFFRGEKGTKTPPGETHITVGNRFPPAPVRSPPDPRLRGIPLRPSAKVPARKIWFRV